MFGIGGGELIFIMFIVLMLFGSDKVPEIARTMGKAMAQLKNATNDIKSEIQKGAETNGFDSKSLGDLRVNLTSEIDKVKNNLLGETAQYNDLAGNITTEINKAKDNMIDDISAPLNSTKEVLEDISGPVKRQM
ncbi:sec-independent protein translocase protein TatA [Flavobacterium segetis]|uniref:Sec-independent protein translocase protein TatA n=1 Tax=Flavobacterium segetis TaxID=271157 RepID=A0A1M5H0Q4_9FLAO|nr:twin-arginine translocase TatA/TatE family subunit [Flavobacterium segetis]SHG09591.1 sec-independent protein translocase protein TatA [Flavobacterium segetis]